MAERGRLPPAHTSTGLGTSGPTPPGLRLGGGMAVGSTLTFLSEPTALLGESSTLALFHRETFAYLQIVSLLFHPDALILPQLILREPPASADLRQHERAHSAWIPGRGAECGEEWEHPHPSPLPSRERGLDHAPDPQDRLYGGGRASGV